MSENEKSCSNCRYSYMGREDFRPCQKCSNLDYNSPSYTHEMFMEDWELGYCRFWAPNTQKG